MLAVAMLKTSGPLSPVSAFPEGWTVREALDVYLEENGFTKEGYDAEWTDASFLGVRFRVPNTARHRWGIKLHDIHHVATGFGTDLVGEGEISAWELRDAPRTGPYVASIVLLGALMGFAFSPSRALAALRAGRRQRRLFGGREDPARYEAWLSMTVGELRDSLGLPRAGLNASPRRLHVYAPDPARG